MDFQFNKGGAQLSLSNGHYLLSASVPKSQQPACVKHCFELELNCDPVCQQEFLALQESKFPEHTNITASLLNFDYPYADLLEVEKVQQKMKYVFSITLIRSHWQYKVSLHSFIPEFIHTLNKSNLLTKLEFEDDFGYYLTITLILPPTSDLRKRITTISRKISNAQYQVLLDMCQ